MTAEYFDQWYVDVDASQALAQLKQDHLGLPADLDSTSPLTLRGLHEVRDLLALGEADTLLDLACGRGGYGMWLARDSGCRLCGVDFSAVAIRQAVDAAARLGQSARCEFRVGELAATGLPDGCVDAVVCIDAIQFAADIVEAAAEIRRVLRPGGLAVVTCWEPVDRRDDQPPARLRAVDLDRQLTRAGFVAVTVEERPDWRPAERALLEAAAALDPGDDPALASLAAEAGRVLPIFDRIRRVLATARA